MEKQNNNAKVIIASIIATITILVIVLGGVIFANGSIFQSNNKNQAGNQTTDSKDGMMNDINNYYTTKVEDNYEVTLPNGSKTIIPPGHILLRYSFYNDAFDEVKYHDVHVVDTKNLDRDMIDSLQREGDIYVLPVNEEEATQEGYNVIVYQVVASIYYFETVPGLLESDDPRDITTSIKTAILSYILSQCGDPSNVKIETNDDGSIKYMELESIVDNCMEGKSDIEELEKGYTFVSRLIAIPTVNSNVDDNYLLFTSRTDSNDSETLPGLSMEILRAMAEYARK
jgi:hypothetical protein